MATNDDHNAERLSTSEISRRFISIAPLAQLVKVKGLIEMEAFRRFVGRRKRSQSNLSYVDRQEDAESDDRGNLKESEE